MRPEEAFAAQRRCFFAEVAERTEKARGRESLRASERNGFFRSIFFG